MSFTEPRLLQVGSCLCPPSGASSLWCQVQPCFYGLRLPLLLDFLYVQSREPSPFLVRPEIEYRVANPYYSSKSRGSCGDSLLLLTRLYWGAWRQLKQHLAQWQVGCLLEHAIQKVFITFFLAMFPCCRVSVQ